MDKAQSLHEIIERGIRLLTHDQKLKILADLAAGREIDDLPYASPEERFAFNQGRKKLMAEVSPEIAQSVAVGLILELTAQEIDRQVSRERTRPLPPPPRRPRSRKGGPNQGPLKVVVGESGPLRTDELAEFLELFDRVYALGVALPEGLLGVAGPAPGRPELVNRLNRTVRSAEPSRGQVSALVIAKIRKASPLTIWFEAVSSVLVVAVIISGGEVDLSKGKFKVHSLGDGLKKLRDLFAGSAPRGPKKPPSKRVKR